MWQPQQEPPSSLQIEPGGITNSRLRSSAKQFTIYWIPEVPEIPQIQNVLRLPKIN